MAKLADVLAYLIAKTPLSINRSNARLTKLVYLADWKHVLETGEQISEIDWYFNHYGPFVWDVQEAAVARRDLFKIEEGFTAGGNTRTYFSLRVSSVIVELTPSEHRALDDVLATTRDLNWASFIQLVYSTYPVATSDRHTHLDLRAKAVAYKESPFYGAS